MNYHWTQSFKSVYDQAALAYQAGQRGPSQLFSEDDTTFLASIGCTPQELYDFVEDAINDSEPDFETCLLITAARRDYFFVIQGGQWTGRITPSHTLPAKTAEIEGIPWLPRIIEKAKIKLRGEMDPNLMFGCGGDRPFLAKFDIHPADFLRKVWAANGEDQAVVDYVRASAR